MFVQVNSKMYMLIMMMQMINFVIAFSVHTIIMFSARNNNITSIIVIYGANNNNNNAEFG